MLKRKAESAIMNWINDPQKALLIYGVRQCGKTFIIRECLKKSGVRFVEFNLISKPEIVDILAGSGSVDDLILKLSLYSDTELVPGETFLFFDEIQRYKEIVTKIKFLVEDKRFYYIMSGSLLGIEITNLKSAPVGYVQELMMYPMDFEEFLDVFRITEQVKNLLQEHYRDHTPVDENIHRRMMELFRLYLLIGGMPAAVKLYRDTGNIDKVMREHRAIIEQYRLDFTQYEAENRRLIISRIYELIPAQLNEKNKRFKIADIDKNLRYERVEDSFVWLWKAGVALPVLNVTEPKVPLILNEKHSLMKLFLSDVGMLTTICGKSLKLKIAENAADINYGSIYENVTAQELIAHGFKLYYYNSKKFGELDFVLENGDYVLPIEVKSGKDYEKHSALNHILAKEQYGIKEACVLCNENLHVKNNVIYLPVYMLMFLQAEENGFADISPEKYMFC